MKDNILKFLLVLVFIFCFSSTSSLANKIRIGSLQYGSVNWELKLIQDLGLDKKNSFELEIVELASKNAAAVALQGGAVDLIVTDWFWVSRQRNEKRLFSFIPHSMAAGGLIASKKSSIKNDLDLKNKKGKMSELQPVFVDYVNTQRQYRSCNTPQQWSCKFDYWLQDEYEFTTEELDELRSDRGRQSRRETSKEVTI